ncbi:MAG: heterodisulfide reductase-related iron-sulfur binding cluster [Acidimicrobiia bacterium]|nr:heterodisulfide reductase-related iron-sulfur binding cluster [Acidimicrobiia bacterium]
MTTTYDPHDRVYLDAADARVERDRVFDLCHGCRLCWNLCPSFETLFDLIDEVHGDDPHALTGDEHDRIVGECYQCKLCYLKCPYVPPHEWDLDFPRLMMRSLSIQRAEGKVDRSANVLARTDLQGKVASKMAGAVNAANRTPWIRRAMEKTVGIAADRVLPNFAKVRFSRWFGRHPRRPDPPKGEVTLFPTCIVEYQEPAIGKDMVGVYEHNGIGCDLPEGQVCCGMPWLDAGDVDRFMKHAKRNVEVLDDAATAGRPIIVPQPTCAYVLKKEYPEYLQTDAARRVADSVQDVSEHLMGLHRNDELDTDFDGDVPESIVWHAACHYRAQQMGPRSKQLLELTGAEVEIVEKCSAIDGTWGLRAENVELARKVATPLMRRVEESDATVVAGDCHLANTAIDEATGRGPTHPIQLLARAYGIPDDD